MHFFTHYLPGVWHDLRAAYERWKDCRYLRRNPPDFGPSELIF